MLWIFLVNLFLLCFPVLYSPNAIYLPSWPWASTRVEGHLWLRFFDNWNRTSKWKCGEFIYIIRGAYNFEKDISDCIYGEAGNYYQSLDFSLIMNCETSPSLHTSLLREPKTTPLDIFLVVVGVAPSFHPSWIPAQAAASGGMHAQLLQMDVHVSMPHIQVLKHVSRSTHAFVQCLRFPTHLQTQSAPSILLQCPTNRKHIHAQIDIFRMFHQR